MTSFLTAFLQCQRTGRRPSRRRRGARLGRSSSSSRRGVGGSEGDDLVEGGGGGGSSGGGGGGDDEAVEVRVSHRLHRNEIHVVVVSRRGRRRKGGRTPSVMNALVTPGLSSAISSHSGTIRIERRPAAAGVSTGCSGEQAPAHAITCGNQECANFGRGDIRCFCTAEKCNSATTYPTSCDPQPEPESEPESEPGNGVEGKAGAVISVLAATIFAAII